MGGCSPAGLSAPGSIFTYDHVDSRAVSTTYELAWVPWDQTVPWDQYVPWDQCVPWDQYVYWGRIYVVGSIGTPSDQIGASGSHSSSMMLSISTCIQISALAASVVCGRIREPLNACANALRGAALVVQRSNEKHCINISPQAITPTFTPWDLTRGLNR